LVLVGQVSRAVETRTSPVGIPISRFSLEHRSRQLEAGNEREVFCRIVVVVAGEALQAKVAKLSVGDSLKVEGFISRSSYRSEASHLVLHALQLEMLD
jgi:primosomal replication protein N